MKKNIVIVAGPTASGKTAIGIELAKKLNGEIISSDSMQVYKYMDIGSAKPTREEMQGIPHHMIDIIEPDEEFTVALYRKMAGEAIDDILSRKKLPIIVGGTGLYINSFTYPLNFTESSQDKDYRDYLTEVANVWGNEYVHDMLKQIDPDSHAKLHPNNLRRVIRALEVYKNTGKTMSEYQKESMERDIEYNIAYIGLIMDRKLLYDRINKRVDKMFDMGLVDEIKKLWKMGYTRDMNSMQGIGYKEIFDYLDGLYTIEEVKEIIKQNSRRYAKRQLTWFRREERIYWAEVDKFENMEEIIENVTGYIEGKLKLL